ncbi:MAG TPA: hypothetical protein VM680_08600 [Verrucomicrobiae bacterium]|nr:hypothetical protein [Verrucomicrobiae bacterium]
MSAVDLAISKVKKLSPSEARELLLWLDNRKSATAKHPTRRRRKKRKPLTMAELKKWEDSIRLTTDWEPPRMPNEMVKPFVF